MCVLEVITDVSKSFGVEASNNTSISPSIQRMVSGILDDNATKRQVARFLFIAIKYITARSNEGYFRQGLVKSIYTNPKSDWVIQTRASEAPNEEITTRHYRCQWFLGLYWYYNTMVIIKDRMKVADLSGFQQLFDECQSPWTYLEF